MGNAPINQIGNSVKLVIWDLDDTFWNGTLSEEGISVIEANMAMVKTLVDRGIMCSICSKNDFSEAKAALEKLGMWEWFVFPHIQWSPKGQAITQMLGKMGLRAENVVFIDDNHLNIEEAHFTNPGLMLIDGNQPLAPFLDLPEFAGKPDTEHARLKQYRMLETKVGEQAETGLSNLDFLRQSGIKVRIIFDLEDQFDRICELLNRTNQLNYTKVRANTPDEQRKLRDLLATSGMHAGLVQVQDRYGDYGIVGFFCLRLKYSGTKVHHFSFSCRAMNMGVEQWVWEYLEKPEFKTVGPVANRLDQHEVVDWITEVADFDDQVSEIPQRRLCLVGGCDLLQVSFYCGTERHEFVNKQDENSRLVRFDDVGFFLNPRSPELRHSRELREFVGYTYEDMVAFDVALARSDIILLSMLHSTTTDNLYSFGDSVFGGTNLATIPPRRFQKLMEDPGIAGRFAKQMYRRPYDLDQRLRLAQRSFMYAAAKRQNNKPLFILSAVANLGKQAERNRETRLRYNEMCRAFCHATPNAHFVDIEALLNEEDFTDSDHYTRTGHFKIADFVNTQAAAHEAAVQAA